jgi:hypothetical protein
MAELWANSLRGEGDAPGVAALNRFDEGFDLLAGHQPVGSLQDLERGWAMSHSRPRARG